MRKTKSRAKRIQRSSGTTAVERMRGYIAKGLGVPQSDLPSSLEAAVRGFATKHRSLRRELVHRAASPALSEDRTEYFFDTEFIEDGKTIELISIGVVTLDDREYYACNQDADLSRASPWVRENVLPHLPRYGDPAWRSHPQIAVDLIHFTQGRPKPRFWAYYADYDWVALCQLYGTMMQLPEYFPRFCMDLKQHAVMLGVDSLPPQAKGGEHSALDDARWNRTVLQYLAERS